MVYLSTIVHITMSHSKIVNFGKKCTHQLFLQEMCLSSLTVNCQTLRFIVWNVSEFNNVCAIKLLLNYCPLVRSKFQYCSVIWSPYQHQYINLLETILRTFSKYLHFKMFGIYPEKQWNQNALLNVNEVFLECEKSTNYHFLQCNQQLPS